MNQPYILLRIPWIAWRSNQSILKEINPVYSLEKWYSFPGGSVSKDTAWNAGDLDSMPGLGTSPGEGTATHSSILAWEIPWTKEPGWLHTVHGVARVGHDWATTPHHWKDWCWIWSFGHLIWRDDLLEKTLMLERLKAGGGEGNKGWGGWMALSTQWTWVWETPWGNEGQGSLVCYIVYGVAESDTT